MINDIIYDIIKGVKNGQNMGTQDNMKEKILKIPDDDYKNEYSGKIALRISKSTHKRLAEISDNEGISINSLINNAIENYIGLKQYDMNINKKIDDLKEIAESSLGLQQVNTAINQKVWQDVTQLKNFVTEGVYYE